MGTGYFGKLPARADFVIGQCPAGFLKSWEAFLMTGSLNPVWIWARGGRKPS